MPLIWVAEDYENLRLAMQYLLERIFADEESKIETFCNAEEILLAIENGSRPNLLITDFQMGKGITGLSLAILLREKFPDIKTIIITGNPEKADEALENGFRALQKPFSKEDLTSAINAELNTCNGY